MKVVILRLAIALLTFLVGVITTGLLTVSPPRTAERLSTSVPTASEIKVTPNPPEGWERIDVDKKFSFYLPPDMKRFDPIGCTLGKSDAFTSQSIWVGYEYLSKWQVKEGRGKLTCEVLEGAPTVWTAHLASEVEVGGRKARQTFWRSDNPERTVISLCFPDVDGGAILRFAAGSDDERGMDVARQVFESIEFR